MWSTFMSRNRGLEVSCLKVTATKTVVPMATGEDETFTGTHCEETGQNMQANLNPKHNSNLLTGLTQIPQNALQFSVFSDFLGGPQPRMAVFFVSISFRRPRTGRAEHIRVLNCATYESPQFDPNPPSLHSCIPTCHIYSCVSACGFVLTYVLMAMLNKEQGIFGRRGHLLHLRTYTWLDTNKIHHKILDNVHPITHYLFWSI